MCIRDSDGRVMNLPPRRDLPIYAPFDIGFTDPTAIWYVRLDEAGWYDFIDYDEIMKASVTEWVPDLKAKPWYYGSLLLPHDGPHHEVTSGTTTEKILQAAGFHVQVMPQTSDKAQIPSVRNILPRCRFANTPAVRRGLECLRHYHGTVKREGDRTSHSPKPVHDWSSHACKAMSVFAYFAGELRSGVQPPKKQVANLNSSPHAGGTGWMS